MAGGEAARTPRHLSHHLPWGVSPLGAPSALSTRGQVRGRGPRPPTATCTDTRLPRTPKRPPDASPGRTPALHSNAIRTKAELSSTLPPPPAPCSSLPLGRLSKDTGVCEQTRPAYPPDPADLTILAHLCQGGNRPLPLPSASWNWRKPKLSVPAGPSSHHARGQGAGLRTGKVDV